MNEFLAYKDGRLFVENAGAASLARRFKTPLYAYSRACVLSRLGRIRAAFRRRAPLVCYAMKANPNRRLASLLRAEGAGAEVVSGGELLRALAAGFPPEKIVFSGVGKTEEELRLAVRTGILAVNLESRPELEAVRGVARRLRRRAPISVRLNPDVDAATHAHVATGTPETKFGVEKRAALEMYRAARDCPELRIRGIHCHIGSQISSPLPYAKAGRAVACAVEDLEAMGIRLEFVDIGGGMGIGCGAAGGLDLDELALAVEASLPSRPGTRLILEPGRSLVAEAGVLFTRVLRVKKTSKREFVVVDAGMNDLVRPALYDAHHGILPEKRPRGGEPRRTVDVVGPVCESADFLARGARLAMPAEGDILAVLDAGAYGFSMSSQYNSRPRAAEVLVDGARAALIRRRERLADLIACEL